MPSICRSRHLSETVSRGALATSVKPVFKILNFDDVRDLGIPDLHGDGGQAASDVADPVVTAHRGEGLRDGFVERFGRHVERMRGSFRSWTTTVQALRATMAIYHIRYLFANA